MRSATMIGTGIAIYGPFEQDCLVWWAYKSSWSYPQVAFIIFTPAFDMGNLARHAKYREISRDIFGGFSLMECD